MQMSMIYRMMHPHSDYDGDGVSIHRDPHHSLISRDISDRLLIVFSGC